MSQASQLLATGLTSLLATNGEQVSFRGLGVVALVTRDEEVTDPRKPHLSENMTSSILFLSDSLSEAPRVGESVTDEFGYTHLIQKVKFTGQGWRCQCKGS